MSLIASSGSARDGLAAHPRSGHGSMYLLRPLSIISFYLFMHAFKIKQVLWLWNLVDQGSANYSMRDLVRSLSMPHTRFLRL